MSETVRAVTFVTLTSLGAVTVVMVTACGSIALTLCLQTLLALFIRAVAFVGEIGIAVVAAITSGFTVSLTVILAASNSAISFPPSRIQARLVVSVVVATASIFSSAMALLFMTSLHINLELGVAVVTSAAFAVAFASAWAVGVMSLVERETQDVGLRMTSLLQAVRHNKYHVLNLLVHLPFGHTQHEYDTAMIYAVKAGFVECVRVLLSAGASANTQDPYDTTPLICASQLGSVTLVNMLLEAGAVVNFRNRSRETALHQSSKYGHEECTRLLLKSGADPGGQDALYRTPLMLTVRHTRNPETISEMLLDAGCYVNSTATEHRTALHYAAMRGIGVGFLLKAGADFDIQDTEGNTALHLAALEGSFDVVEELLDAGAAVEVPNYVRRTPLHLASASGNCVSIEFLIAHGADPTALDSGGFCPINHAISGRKPAAVMFYLSSNYYPHALESHPYHHRPIRPVNPIKTALEQRYYSLIHVLALAGCPKDPIRVSRLVSDRPMFLDDSQSEHHAWVVSCLTQPWALSDLCRCVIRRRLLRPLANVPELPLPKQIRDFLLLKDLEEFVIPQVAES